MVCFWCLLFVVCFVVFVLWLVVCGSFLHLLCVIGNVFALFAVFYFVHCVALCVVCAVRGLSFVVFGLVVCGSLSSLCVVCCLVCCGLTCFVCCCFCLCVVLFVCFELCMFLLFSVGDRCLLFIDCCLSLFVRCLWWSFVDRRSLFVVGCLILAM